MKILTLNTHSLIEPEYEDKLRRFVETVLREQPDIMGFQEVNQTAAADAAEIDGGESYVPCTVLPGEAPVPLRRDNHAARLAELLAEAGLSYYWSWLPVKLGYDRYDEGLAIFSKKPILETDQCLISSGRDYRNWKTRKILGIRTAQGWFYTVHMGWWDDAEEPFKHQWDRVNLRLSERADGAGLWVMGDFNSPAQVRGQGYDYVRASGWTDTYELAAERDDGVTVEQVIDGWKERADSSDVKGMRIDQIWRLRGEDVHSSYVICNGRRGAVVSDHYGVVIEAG